MQRSVVIKRLG